MIPVFVYDDHHCGNRVVVVVPERINVYGFPTDRVGDGGHNGSGFVRRPLDPSETGRMLSDVDTCGGPPDFCWGRPVYGRLGSRVRTMDPRTPSDVGWLVVTIDS